MFLYKLNLFQKNYWQRSKIIWKIEKSFVDWWIIYIVSLLLTFGVLAMMSISTMDSADGFAVLLNHTINIFVGLIAGWFVFNLSLKFWQKRCGLILLITLFILLLVPLLGLEKNSATRWLSLFGIISFQPSEILKFSITLFLAKYIAGRVIDVHQNFRVLLALSPTLFFCIVLLYLQSDYTAIVLILLITFAIILLSGVPLKYIFYIVVPSLSAVLILIITDHNRLERIQAFFNPQQNMFLKGYQAMWSEIAFARGNWFGTGLGQSHIKKVLPEAPTDFIFAIFAEEYGLIWVLFVILLFFLLFLRVCRIAITAFKDDKVFEYLSCMGLISWITIQAMIHFSVNLVLIPTTGITLPLFSYGGSSMVMVLVALAFILKIDFENRKKSFTTK